MNKFFLGTLTVLTLLVSIVGPVLATSVNLPPPPAFEEKCDIRSEWVNANILPDGVTPCPAPGANAASLSTNQAICCVFDTLVMITTWAFWALMILVLLFISIGAYNIITAGGNQEKVTTGRKYIMFAAIGAIAAVAARAIPGFAASLMGLSIS